jgi:hypothetical protein
VNCFSVSAIASIGRWIANFAITGQYGVEAQFFIDRELRISRRFDTKELAVQWATLENRTSRKASIKWQPCLGWLRNGARRTGTPESTSTMGSIVIDVRPSHGLKLLEELREFRLRAEKNTHAKTD